jgi:4-carboxymuconolactone decarboxylase
VSEGELKEIVYMITVPAGFPRAIVASQALSKLFAERAQAACRNDACESEAAPTP